MNDYTYKSGEAVQLGDRVVLRSFFFFKDAGTVVYVPGASPVHPDMECGSIQYVGVKLDGGATGSATIDPETQQVLNLRFVERGCMAPSDALNPNESVFDDT